MKQGRTRLIVAQSLITAILLGVIALTLLSPDHQNTLFAVGVPETPGPVVNRPPTYEPGGGTADGRDGHGAGRHGNGFDSAGGGAGTPGVLGNSAESPSGTEPTDTSPTGPPGDDDGGTGGPPDDQYADTLARLSDTVQ